MEIIFASVVALLTAQVATAAVPVTNPACSVAVIEKHPESVQILGLEDVANRSASRDRTIRPSPSR